MTTLQEMYASLGIDTQVLAFGEHILENLKDRFAAIDETAEYNQLKVIRAMQKARVSEACLLGTTGYGYNDIGRDTLEEVYANLFHAEDALVRPQITCGTHALALALMSIILIEASTFRAQGGIKGFLKSFTKPMALLTPLNVMEIAIRPLSLCMRLFGNVLGAFVVMQLIEHVCGLIIPMVFSMYFDVFDGLIQAYVFVFLTSLFMAEGMEVEEESVPKLQQA